MAFMVTDEIFAVSIFKKGPLYPLFSYGLIITSVFGWVLGTILGSVAGQILPQIFISSLGLAIYGMFIAIIIPETRVSKAIAAVVISAMAMSCVFTYAPYLKMISAGFRIIIVTVVVAAVAAIVAPVREEKA